MVAFDSEMGFVDETYVSQSKELVLLRNEITILQESYDEAAMAMLRLRQEDEGWGVLGQVKQDDGFTLPVIKDVAIKAEVQSVGNPLLKHGFDLRFNPIFSRQFKLSTEDGTDLKPRHQRKIDNATVQETLFSAEGYEALERTCYNAGNLFLAYNRITGDMLRIPFNEISNRAVDPDFPSRTAYYQWTHERLGFDGKTKEIVEWLPVVEWWKAGSDTIDDIAQHPVNHDWTVIDMRVNVPTTGHWGIPDVFAALPYAWAYSEYIRDAASLLKALTKIAWKVVGKSKTQAQTAGVQIASQRKIGGVASMTAGTDLAAMPKAGQVDMADGMAMAAMVASSLGVSTSALLTVTGGGTSAAVTSLDGPTVAMARARQDRWIRFYDRVFTAMGIDGVSIVFPKITEDPIYRTVASLVAGRASGAIWADEFREAFLDAMSLDSNHPDAPPVDEYAKAQNAVLFMQTENAEDLADKQAKTAAIAADAQARQGNSPTGGGINETDNNGLRDQDTKAAQTNNTTS
jgi:hypothetical protein